LAFFGVARTGWVIQRKLCRAATRRIDFVSTVAPIHRALDPVMHPEDEPVGEDGAVVVCRTRMPLMFALGQILGAGHSAEDSAHRSAGAGKIAVARCEHSGAVLVQRRVRIEHREERVALKHRHRVARAREQVVNRAEVVIDQHLPGD
jgi:hypothetical protein